IAAVLKGKAEARIALATGRVIVVRDFVEAFAAIERYHGIDRAAQPAPENLEAQPLARRDGDLVIIADIGLGPPSNDARGGYGLRLRPVMIGIVVEHLRQLV